MTIHVHLIIQLTVHILTIDWHWYQGFLKCWYPETMGSNTKLISFWIIWITPPVQESPHINIESIASTWPPVNSHRPRETRAWKLYFHKKKCLSSGYHEAIIGYLVVNVYISRRWKSLFFMGKSNSSMISMAMFNIKLLPSGNLTSENHHVLWENPLFLWPCSSSLC